MKHSAKLLALLLIAVVPRLYAAPWIEPGDERLRHHLQVLVDSDIVKVPVNTWPVMWSGVIRGVQQGKRTADDPVILRSINYVERAFKDQTRRSSGRIRADYAEQFDPVTSFSAPWRDESEVSVSLEWLGERWAARLQSTWVDDPRDDKTPRADGSYISLLTGNWAIIAGSIDRWWGPGWQSGLILSNNARPVPGIAFQRNYANPFETPWLSWLGPWQFVTFIGELESDRVVPEAKLVGARFNFRPAPWFEFGFSRTAQWGGDGRSESLSNLADLALGRDNAGSDGITSTNQPGNQLGGWDFRLSGTLGAADLAFYGEFVGEDEAGVAPSKYTAMAGLELFAPIAETDLRLYAEWADTATRRFHTTPDYNVAYEHSVYQSGYRHRGRSLGASVDNDTRIHTLGALWYPSARDAVHLQVAKLDLNNDGGGRAFPTGNSVARGASDGWRAQMSYTREWKHWVLELGYRFYDGDLRIRGLDSGDDTGTIDLTYRW